MRIALVSDFCYPSLGGVEIHIHYLASILVQKGHHVIIITHHYGENYIGQRFLQKEKFKVYYLKIAYSKSTNVIYPTFLYNFPKARKILFKEKIQIVHLHQSTSTLGLQFSIFASYLGLKIIQTQHSLYGYTSLYDIHLNGTLSSIFKLFDHFITVSRTTRNNLILRTQIDPKKTTVIPNGVKINIKECEKQSKFDDGFIHIVVLGRLVYRRGTDLLIEILPQFLKRNKNVKIHVIGDGPKMNPLKARVQKLNFNQFNDQSYFKDRVNLLGSKPNAQALKFMSKCDIYLNTALTQSFGIALVQAASLGLLCVSTNVGSIWEILPESILELVEVNPNGIIIGLEKTIKKIERKKLQASIRKKSSQSQKHSQSNNNNNNNDRQFHEFGYKWQDCVDRTIEVYQQILKQPKKTKTKIIKDSLKQIFFKGNYIFLLYLFLICTYRVMQIFGKLMQAKIFNKSNKNEE